MNEGQLPTFESGKVYLLTGAVLNQLKDAIIKEIIVDEEEFTVDKDTPNKVTLSLADGVEWREIEDCDGNTMEVLTRNFVDGGSED